MRAHVHIRNCEVVTKFAFNRNTPHLTELQVDYRYSINGEKHDCLGIHERQRLLNVNITLQYIIQSNEATKINIIIKNLN